MVGPVSTLRVGEQMFATNGIQSVCLLYRFFHIIPTLILHATFLRDLERHLGWVRTSIIYLGSGIFGNLLSAVVTPYYPTVSLNVLTLKRATIILMFAYIWLSVDGTLWQLNGYHCKFYGVCHIGRKSSEQFQK